MAAGDDPEEDAGAIVVGSVFLGDASEVGEDEFFEEGGGGGISGVFELSGEGEEALFAVVLG